MKNLTVSEEILLKYFKTPFDEKDAQKIVNSENAVKSCTEVTIIWSMLEAAKLLDDFSSSTAARHYPTLSNLGIMKGLLSGSIQQLPPIPEEEEEEDLL